MKIEWHYEKRILSDLREYDRNPRLHNFYPIESLPGEIIKAHYFDMVGRLVIGHFKRCSVCHEYFKAYRCLIENRKYCSHKCGSQVYAKINGTQKREQVRKRNSEAWFIEKVSSGLKAHFLRNPRKNEQWYLKQYGVGYVAKSKYKHSGDWKKISARLIKQVGECNECGTKTSLCVHHIIPYSISKDNSIGNLVVLCSSCHRRVESKALKAIRIVNNWEVIKILYRRQAEDAGRPILYKAVA